MTERELLTLRRAVRQARKQLGLRQRDLAQALGFSQAWLSAFESGRIQGTSPLLRWDRVEALRRWLQEQEGVSHAGETAKRAG